MKSHYDRQQCWLSTKKISETLPIPPMSIKSIYDPNFVPTRKFDITHIFVVDNDTLDCGLLLKKNNNLNPVVLNMANNFFPGGCVDIGCNAQEESLFRRTNYYKTLTIDNYPLNKDEAIYSKDVLVFKENENNGWIVTEPEKMSFIACAAIRNPEIILQEDKMIINAKYKNIDDVEIMKNKIRLILQIAYKNNHDSVVLSAFGCGAFYNPTHNLALIMKDVLREYDGLFKVVYIAILSNFDKNTNYNFDKTNNYDVFKHVFNS